MRILPWASISTSIAPPSINLANARGLAWVKGKDWILLTNSVQAALGHKKDSYLSPALKLTPPAKSDLNFTGKDNLPFWSMLW